MTQPLRGHGLLPKSPALSSMKQSVPNLWTRPETTRTPGEARDPVRMNTPAGAAAGPTVGANCRRGVTTDAMGWLNLGPMDTGGIRGGVVHRKAHTEHTKHTSTYPGSGLS